MVIDALIQMLFFVMTLLCIALDNVEMSIAISLCYIAYLKVRGDKMQFFIGVLIGIALGIMFVGSCLDGE
jgi:hypothetical protein